MITTLSEQEIFDILYASMTTKSLDATELLRRLKGGVSLPFPEKTAGAEEADNDFARWMSTLISKRMIRNDQTIPLYSSDDINEYIPTALQTMCKVDQQDLGPEEMKQIEVFAKGLVENLMMQLMPFTSSADESLYTKYWEWLDVVLKVSRELEIHPTEVFALREATDRMASIRLSKEEYIEAKRKRYDTIMNFDKVADILMGPMVQLLCPDDAEKQAQMKMLILESQPEITEQINNTRNITEQFIVEEANRIYGEN